MTDSDLTGTVGGHEDVLGVPGSPPWHSCQRCGAYRSTYAGLADLPCEPDRYRDVDASERVSVGEIHQGRIDQSYEHPDRTCEVLGHTKQTGVRFHVKGSDYDLARGDEVELRINALGDDRSVIIRRVVSTDERVPSPTLTYVGSDDARTDS